MIFFKKLQDFVDDYKNSVKQIVLICEKICDTKILYIPPGIIYELEDLENQIEAYRADALVKIIKHYQDVLKFLMIIYEGFENDIQAVRFQVALIILPLFSNFV